MGIQPARVREEPDRRCVDGSILRSDLGPGIAEPHPIGLHPQNRKESGAVAPDLPPQGRGPSLQLLGGELRCRGRRPRHHIGDPQPKAQQLLLLEGRELPRGEPGSMKSRPEAIARASEVVPGGARIEARIDAAEDDIEPRSDQIPDPLAVGGL